MQYEYFMVLHFHEHTHPKLIQIAEDDVEKQSQFIGRMMSDPSRPYWKEASIQRRQVGGWETVYEP